MKGNSFQLRPMMPEDCIKLPSLLERVYGIKSDEAYWRWKYIEPPFETMAYVTQKQDNEIMALTGFWINEARIGGRDFPVYQLIDVMADPNYRGGGAYRPILKLVKDMVLNQNKVLYGFTNDVSHALFGKVFKDETIISIKQPSYSLIINPGDMIKAPDFIKTLIGKVTRGIVQARLSLAGTGKIQVEMTDTIPEEVNQLWEEVQKDYYGILKRNSENLKWRFQKAPQGHYQIWLARLNGSLAGYMVTALAKTPHKTKGFIVDWLTSRQKPQVFNSLLNQALKWFVQKNTNVVETWFLNTEDHLVKALKSKLFIRSRRTKPFLMVCKNPVMYHEEFAQADDFFATLGNSDFRGT